MFPGADPKKFLDSADRPVYLTNCYILQKRTLAVAIKDLPRLTRVEMMLLAALMAKESKEQYGLEIVETVKKITQGRQSISLGGLYTTLNRMESKGLVVARWGDSTEVRQGARRRYYKITGLGERALAETKSVLLKVLRLALTTRNLAHAAT